MELYTKTSRNKSKNNPNVALENTCENVSTEGTKNTAKKFTNIHFGFFDSFRFLAFTVRSSRFHAFAFSNLQDCTKLKRFAHVTLRSPADCK